MLSPVSGDVPDLDSGPVLVAAWAAELTRTAAAPPALSPAELERLLAGVVTTLSLAGAAVPLDVERARGAGASLAYAGLVAPDVLPVAISVLGTHLAGVLWAAGAADPAAITPRIVAAVADGYVRTLRSRVHEVAGPHRSDTEVSPALRTSEARFQAVFTHAGTGIILGDPYGRILDVNASFAEMLGYSIEEVRGRDVRELIHPDEVPRMMDGFTAMIETGAEIRRFDRRYLHRDGHVVLTELTSSFVRDDHGEPIMVIVLVVDITQRHELQQRLRHQALHDPLTGLPNRSLFQERLQELFATPGSRVGLCYLDLDRFKAVNDRLGHEVGDGLLVAVAERLRGIVAEHGHLVARMGGDEFVVLVPEPAAGELPRLAERILAALAEPIYVGDHHLSISASIGIVESEVATTTPANLVKSADVTLYWAKSDGRGRWATFDPERNARDMTSYTVLATLGQGVERNEFHVVYQPIVDLADGRVLGVEALVRWEHPVLGYLTPDQFIGHAEDSGLIVPLGQAVLDQACTEIADWNAAHPDRPLYVSVNLALRQAAEPDPGRRGRRGARAHRPAGRAAAAGGDRERPARPGRPAGGRDQLAGRDGHPDGPRRLRLRLLEPGLPAAAAAAHAQDRRHPGRGPARPHRRCGAGGRQPRPAGARAGPAGHRRGCGDRRPGRAAAWLRLRLGTGLALREGGPAERVDLPAGGRPARRPALSDP